jgi:hypothetical protein
MMLCVQRLGRVICVCVMLVGCALLAPAGSSAQDYFVVEGRVVAEDSGKPLPGARITLSGPQTSVRTDTEGRFEVAIPAAEPSFRVTKPGYVFTPGRASRSQRNLVVRMPRGGVLTVHLFNAAGEPAHRTVQVSGGSNNRSMSFSAGTDDRGQLRVPNLIQGRYTISVGGSTGVLVRLPPRQLSDAEVIELRKEMTQRSTGGKAATLAAVDVRPGQETAVYLVDVPLPTAVHTIDLRGAPEQRATSTLEGRVVDAEGSPISGVAVTLLAGLSIRGAASDASGAFRIDNLPAGTFGVTASKQGFAMAEPERTAASISLEEGERRQGVVLRMVSASEITGRVLDEFAEPVERAVVFLLRMGVAPQGDAITRVAAAGPSDEQGRYRIPRVAPGAYALLTIGETAGYGETHLYYPGVVSLNMAHMVEVSEGRDVAGIDFRLNPGAGHRLTGMVVDSMGNPLSGTSVELIGPAPQPRLPLYGRTTRLTRSGAFAFLNVAPGSYTVSVRTQPIPSVPQVANGRVIRPDVAPESGEVKIQIGDAPPDRIMIRTSPVTSALAQ